MSSFRLLILFNLNTVVCVFSVVYIYDKLKQISSKSSNKVTLFCRLTKNGVQFTIKI